MLGMWLSTFCAACGIAGQRVWRLLGCAHGAARASLPGGHLAFCAAVVQYLDVCGYSDKKRFAISIVWTLTWATVHWYERGCPADLLDVELKYVCPTYFFIYLTNAPIYKPKGWCFDTCGCNQVVRLMLRHI